MPLLASSNLVVGQWSDSPKLRAVIDAMLDPLRTQALPAFERLRLMTLIDQAVGVFLDYLGARVGVDRPSTNDPSMDARWGFTGPMQSKGFDTVPFKGDQVNDAVYPLGDTIFRRFVKARAVLVLGDGTEQTFTKGVRYIDPAAQVRDNRDMSITVLTDRQVFLELADTAGALPRTAGVRG